ncbi:MAG: toxin-antitoxin system, antitoxin component, Xre family protein, partial [Acidobacteria bacterium]
MARRIAALPPAKRAAVAEFVERLLADDRQLVAAAGRSSEAVFGRIWDNPDDAEYDRL